MQLEFIKKKNMSIPKNVLFPGAVTGDKVLWEEEYYIYNGTEWVLE